MMHVISNLEKWRIDLWEDDRLDSVRATDFAVRAMAATWNDARVRASGMSVEWALLDAGEGIGQTSAIPATYTGWREQSP